MNTVYRFTNHGVHEKLQHSYTYYGIMFALIVFFILLTVLGFIS